MNKNYKVVTINGIRGLIAVVFIVLGLIAGFIISPGWVCMKAWNYMVQDSNVVSQMNIYQGIILWTIIALSLYLLNNKQSLIGFNSFQGLSPEQIKDIMKRTREAELKMLKTVDLNKKDDLNVTETVSSDVKQEEPEEAGR